MRFNQVFAGVLFLSTFFAGAVAVEGGPFGPYHGAAGMMGARLQGLKTMIQLDLSASQKSKILSITEKYEKERANLKESLKEARRDLARVLQAEQPGEDEIRSALRLAAPIREELFVIRVKMMAELKTVLTHEQLQLLEERKGHRIEWLKSRIGTVNEDTGT